MPSRTFSCSRILVSLILGILGAIPLAAIAQTPNQPKSTCQTPSVRPNFLVFGGGGNPSNNEIALEKNILYFQRTLKTFGHNPQEATTFFANGNDGTATIRYLDEQGKQQFKIPTIPHLEGSATLNNLQNWLKDKTTKTSDRPIFFYFTGHGIENPDDSNNNALILWQDRLLTVQKLTQMLDYLPQNTPVVTMMAQCYSGSFANFIYEGGDPKKPVALHTRCGFFATIKTLPSVGCTPEVNEADYKDYSSSFFAGLSGQSRTGQPVASADYNQDGKVSYAEAHAFAKVDEQTIDLPISTLEAWLQEQASEVDFDQVLNQPISTLLEKARPEQQYVITSLLKQFNFNPQKSYIDNGNQLKSEQVRTDVEEAYLVRFAMELMNIGMEQKIRRSSNSQDIAIIDRLIHCESGSWH